ncbi:hypothetical protein CHS0354_003753 [Potamilus streckersoni]|uniref:Uncharacterized protein n=1 Tax=Potamilus streckersoni TaxID=2493646 RepID=A0AAE0RTZ8_9BIVA|nr:hypothetical protein CHS0354_003753 [Potamilus streckersoni]
MTPDMPPFDARVPYSRNPWVFSNCSVRTFKQTLKHRIEIVRKGNKYLISHQPLPYEKTFTTAFK